MKIMSCDGVLIRADEVLYAVVNTGSTVVVYLKCGRSIVVRMCIAAFEKVWQEAISENL